MQAAKDLGYIPNQFARRLRSGKSKLIGLVVTEMDTAFVADIIAGVEQTLAAEGYNVLVFSTFRDIQKEKKVVRAAFEMMAEGLIVAACEEPNSVLANLVNRKYPVVYVDSVPPAETAACVINDMYAIAELGLRYLLELGHRDILLVNGHEMYRNFSSYARFEQTYRRILGENGIPVNDKMIKYAGAYARDGSVAVQQAIEQGLKFSAVFAISDIIALGVIEGLERRGLHVPDEVSVIGIDDSEVSSLKRIGLSTIATCTSDSGKQNMGMLAANMLLEMLDDPDKRAGVQSVVLDPRLVLRDSCRSVQSGVLSGS